MKFRFIPLISVACGLACMPLTINAATHRHPTLRINTTPPAAENLMAFPIDYLVEKLTPRTINRTFTVTVAPDVQIEMPLLHVAIYQAVRQAQAADSWISDDLARIRVIVNAAECDINIGYALGADAGEHAGMMINPIAGAFLHQTGDAPRIDPTPIIDIFFEKAEVNLTDCMVCPSDSRKSLSLTDIIGIAQVPIAATLLAKLTVLEGAQKRRKAGTLGVSYDDETFEYTSDHGSEGAFDADAVASNAARSASPRKRRLPAATGNADSPSTDGSVADLFEAQASAVATLQLPAAALSAAELDRIAQATAALRIEEPKTPATAISADAGSSNAQATQSASPRSRAAETSAAESDHVVVTIQDPAASARAYKPHNIAPVAPTLTLDTPPHAPAPAGTTHAKTSDSDSDSGSEYDSCCQRLGCCPKPKPAGQSATK
jgi:hypothetical protein